MIPASRPERHRRAMTLRGQCFLGVGASLLVVVALVILACQHQARLTMAMHDAGLDRPPGVATVTPHEAPASGQRPLDAVVASRYALISTSALAATLVLLGGLVWIVTGVLRRVTVLSEGVGRLVSGDLTTRLVCDSRDEIGLLADRINQLAETLARHSQTETEGPPSSRDHIAPAAASPDQPPASPDGTSVCRVLVVEDGPENRRFMNLVLRRAGIDVVLADNGQEAVQKALDGNRSRDPAFDLILMDMEMPVMNGRDATRVLRQHGYRGPIIAVTGSTQGYDRQKCLDAGCDQYVSKPVDQETLLALVGTVGSQSAPGTSAPACPK